MELPAELWTCIFRMAGLQHLDGLEDRCNCMRVCKQWRTVLDQPEFWHAGRVPVAFDNAGQLCRFLTRFKRRHSQLRELEWVGHLRGQSLSKEEEFLQRLMPPPEAPWGGLRVLSLQDCSLGVSSQCRAALAPAIARACPRLQELRFRGASASYSPHHVSARSQLLVAADLLAIVQGCPELRILDMACCGSNPFAQRFGIELLHAISGHSSLESITLFGELPWDRLGCLGKCRTLRELTLFGACNMPQLPFSLPEISGTVTRLSLQEYTLGSKPLISLSSALPALQAINVQVMSTVVLVAYDVRVAEYQESMDRDTWHELQQLRSYFEQLPYPKAVALKLEHCDMRAAVERLRGIIGTDHMRRAQQMVTTLNHAWQPGGLL